MTPEIEIRKAVTGDISAIAALEAECFSDASTENAISVLFGMGTVGIVALDGDTLYAYA